MTIPMRILSGIVKSYQTYFAAWAITKQGNALVRVSNELVQGIAFDRSSRDDYRPTGYICILAAPSSSEARVFVQGLKNANGSPGRRISIGRHEHEQLSVVSALREQMFPNLDQPLYVHQTLPALEKMAIPTLAQSYALATAYAYEGNIALFRYWANTYRRVADKMKEIWDESVESELNFLLSLEEWHGVGTLKTKLDEIITIELRKLIQG